VISSSLKEGIDVVMSLIHKLHIIPLKSSMEPHSQ